MGLNLTEKTEYDYKKEVILTTESLQKAMDFYHDHKISHIKLFHDYCDGQTVDGNAYNKWDTFYRGQNIPVRAHMSIDERAFDEFAWKTLKTEPTTMISVLFYNGKRNESAYECGFFSEEIKRAGDNTVLVNPSPFLLKSTNCKKYIVLDRYFADIYNHQFRDKRFEIYEDFSCNDLSESIFFLCHKKEDLDILCKCIETGSTTLEVSIPISLFYDNRDSLLSLLSENNLEIEKIMLLDPNIFENTPKKRIVLYIKSGNNNNNISLKFLSLNGDKMKILDCEGSLSREQVINSKLSFARELSRIHEKNSKREIKRRKQPDFYHYSKEIRISLKYVTRNNESYPIISYYSIPDDNGRSKKIYPDSEKGLRGKTGDELYHAIDEFILEGDIRDIIINDVKDRYANDRLLTLKSYGISFGSGSNYDISLLQQYYNPNIAISSTAQSAISFAMSYFLLDYYGANFKTFYVDQYASGSPFCYAIQNGGVLSQNGCDSLASQYSWQNILKYYYTRGNVTYYNPYMNYGNLITCTSHSHDWSNAYYCPICGATVP